MGLFDGFTDQEYLDRIKLRDHSAFTNLYSKYFKALVLISNKYVKDVSVGQGIVQDVFMKLWERPFELDYQNSLKSYLYRSVINYSLNYIKREKSISQHHQKIAEEVDEAYLDTLQEEQELKLIIFNEVEQLPAQCKRVFKMSRFEGMKYREIAEALDISEKTVENHMIKALKILRERLFVSKTNVLKANQSYYLSVVAFSVFFVDDSFKI